MIEINSLTLVQCPALQGSQVIAHICRKICKFHKIRYFNQKRGEYCEYPLFVPISLVKEAQKLQNVSKPPKKVHKIGQI